MKLLLTTLRSVISQRGYNKQKIPLMWEKAEQLRGVQPIDQNLYQLLSTREECCWTKLTLKCDICGGLQLFRFLEVRRRKAICGSHHNLRKKTMSPLMPHRPPFPTRPSTWILCPTTKPGPLSAPPGYEGPICRPPPQSTLRDSIRHLELNTAILPRQAAITPSASSLPPSARRPNIFPPLPSPLLSSP